MKQKRLGGTGARRHFLCSFPDDCGFTLIADVWRISDLDMVSELALASHIWRRKAR